MIAAAAISMTKVATIEHHLFNTGKHNNGYENNNNDKDSTLTITK